jgi:hypothetical protein
MIAFFFIALIGLVFVVDAFTLRRHPLEALGVPLARRGSARHRRGVAARNATCPKPGLPRCGGYPMLIIPALIGNQLDADLRNAKAVSLL